MTNLNNQGCIFDYANIANQAKMFAWATGRGGNYQLVLEDEFGDVVRVYYYVNGRRQKRRVIK